MPKMALNKIFWVKGSRVRKTQLERAGTFLNLEFTVSQKNFLDISCEVANTRSSSLSSRLKLKPCVANSLAGL